MRESQLRTVRGGGGDGRNSPAPPRHTQTGQQSHTQAIAKVRPLRQLTAVSVQRLVEQKAQQESAKALFFDTAQRRDWPMLLATALRENRWVIANITLDGRLYSKLDALRLLLVGDRYEISHRVLREAMLRLDAEDLRAIRGHLHQPDTWRPDGLGHWHSVPPPMTREAAQGFVRLWALLATSWA